MASRVRLPDTAGMTAMVISRPETVERRRPLMTPKPLTPSRIAAYRCRVWRSPNSRLGGCQEKAGPNVVGHLQWGNPGWKWGTPVDSASSATGRPDELQMFKCWSFFVRKQLVLGYHSLEKHPEIKWMEHGIWNGWNVVKARESQLASHLLFCSWCPLMIPV